MLYSCLLVKYPFVLFLFTGDVITLVVEQLTAYKSLVCVWKNDKIQCRQWVTIRAENLYPTINAWWGPAELHVEWLSSTVPQLSMVRNGFKVFRPQLHDVYTPHHLNLLVGENI